MTARMEVSSADAGGTDENSAYWRPRQSDNISSPNFTFPFAYDQRATDYALDGFSIVVVFIVMVSLGCTMEISKIKAYIWNPKAVVIAVVVQYGIMPLTAFALGKVFQLDPVEALTVLICGCCPGGNLSNIFSLAANGDMNLSIVMTTCLIILALGMMPLLLHLYTKGLHYGDLQGKVPYIGIVASLLMTFIPCAIGIFVNKKRPQYARCIVKAGIIALLLASVPIIVLSIMRVGSSIWTIFTPHLLGTSALMPFIGFTLGYILPAFFSFSDQCRRTICMEIGCQNMQLCFALLKVTFAPEVIGPLFFFPYLYMVFQLGEGLLLVLVFRSSEKMARWLPNDSTKRSYTTVDRSDAQTSQPPEALKT